MKKPLLCGVLITLSLYVSPAVHAAYNPGIVAADARWVIYADLNTLRDSTLGQELVAALSRAHEQAAGGVVRVNLPKVLTTVGSLTAYGSNLSSNPDLIDGALIVEGTTDLRKITESLLLQGTLGQPEIFSEVSDLPFPAYSMGEPQASSGREQPKLVVAFPPEPIVIVSKSKAQLLKAREVFRGNAPSLGGSRSAGFSKLTPMTEGAYVFAATLVPTDPIFPEKSPQARILQLANSGALELGERGPNTFAHLMLDASSDENAERLMKILQGLTAMLSLAETTDCALSEFLQAASVNRVENRVSMRLSYPSERLVEMAQGLRSATEARPGVPPRRRPNPFGQTVSEWGGEGFTPPEGTDANGLAVHTVDNVSLTNGALITVGRTATGTRDARIDRVEIVPADGSGSLLVFRQDFMRNVGGRGAMRQFAFPGTSGVYTVKVAYMNAPDSNATFTLSVAEPKASTPHSR